MDSIINSNDTSNIKIQENDTASPFISNSQASLSQLNRSRTWNQSELYLIAAFFHYNGHKLSSDSSKKHFKIFKFMSLFVQSRNINQCRSYTNKLLKSFHSINNINKFFEDSLPLYSQIVHKLKPRNQLIFGQETFMQNNDSNDGTMHTVDQIIAEYNKSKQIIHTIKNEEPQRKILIPQARRAKIQHNHSLNYPIFEQQCGYGCRMMEWSLLIGNMCFFP